MKIKEYIFFIILLIALLMAFFSKNTLISVIGIIITCIFFISSFIYSILKWITNKNEVNTGYVKLKTENFLFEFVTIFNIYLPLKRKYIGRVFYLEYFHNKKVEINNFKDFLNTYNVIEKIRIILIIVILIGVIISIIKKIICKGRISSYYILFTNGELINLKDIKEVKIEDSFFGFSKKISFKLDNNSRFIYIKNKFFSQIEETLKSLETAKNTELNT